MVKKLFFFILNSFYVVPIIIIVTLLDFPVIFCNRCYEWFLNYYGKSYRKFEIVFAKRY